MNLSLITRGLKDERMKGWKEMSIWKVSKYEYISRYYRNKGWKEKRYGKYLSMNISRGTTGIKNERMKGEEYMESI